MNAPRTLWHGGVGGLWRGGVVVPDMAEHRYVSGCPTCAAQRAGASALDPATPTGWVYATTDRAYARFYASRATNGWLYRVRLEGEIAPSDEDPFPTWRARRAVVEVVEERGITLTMRERRALFIRWGGTADEFDALLRSIVARRKACAP